MFVGAQIVAAQTNEPLPMFTSAHQFWRPANMLRQPHNAAVKFTVLFYDRQAARMWVQHGGSKAVFVPVRSRSQFPSFVPGQEVLVQGEIVPAEGFDAAKVKITVLNENQWPKAVPVPPLVGKLSEFSRRRVTLDAFVITQKEAMKGRVLKMEIQANGLAGTCQLMLAENSAIPRFAGAFVRITGLLITQEPRATSSTMAIWVQSSEDIEVISWIDTGSRFEMPLTSSEDIARANPNELARVEGTVFSVDPGREIILRDKTGQLTVRSVHTAPWKPGSLITAVGYPHVNGLNRELRAAIPRAAAAAANSLPDGKLARLRLAQQVLALDADEADRGYPVELEGVVSWANPHADFFILNDASGGVRVSREAVEGKRPSTGTMISLKGTTVMGEYAPTVRARSWSVSGRGPPLDARALTFEQAFTGAEECKWVRLVGSLRSVVHDGRWTTCTFTTAGGEFVARLPRTMTKLPELRSVVRVTGVCTAIANARRQLTGLQLLVPSVAQLEWDAEQSRDPFSTVATSSLASLTQFGTVQDANRRVKVSGLVLQHIVGRYFYLQSQETGVLVLSDYAMPLSVGDEVEVVGLLGRQGSRLVLRDALYRRSASRRAEPPAIMLDDTMPLRRELDCRIVSVTASLDGVVRQDGDTRLQLRLGRVTFEGILNGMRTDELTALKPGSLVGLTGVYVLDFDEQRQPRGFGLMLRTPKDVTLLRTPPWWNAQRALSVVSVLGGCIVLGGGWVWALRRQVKNQTRIIEAKIAAQAKLEARFRFIFESLPIGVSWMVNGTPSSRIVNSAHARITGVSADQRHEVAPYQQATHADDWPVVETSQRRLAAGEIEDYAHEIRYVNPAGETRWTVLAGRAVCDPASGERQEISTLVDITKRKRVEAERESLHRQLLETSRLAGMAEVATSVLHNVGNALTSVNVSATVVSESLARSKSSNVTRLAKLLNEHAADLGGFFTNNEKGRIIPGFVAQLGQELDAERRLATEELNQLRKHIDHIKEIVAMQQSHARISGVVESVSVTDLVEDALRMSATQLNESGLEVVREFQSRPVLSAERHKILQIVVNLVHNAKHACVESGRSDGRITVHVAQDDTCVRVAVTDNGVGIPTENLTRIFAHGFTTRKNGHGFGLHSGALAAKEIGGALRAASEGRGKGAKFTLELPLVVPAVVRQAGGP